MTRPETPDVVIHKSPETRTSANLHDYDATSASFDWANAQARLDGLPGGHPELPVTLPPIPDELFPADWSDLNVDDAPPFEIPADGEAAAPADAEAETDDSATEPATDDGASESSPKE